MVRKKTVEQQFPMVLVTTILPLSRRVILLLLLLSVEYIVDLVFPMDYWLFTNHALAFVEITIQLDQDDIQEKVIPLESGNNHV